MDEKFTDAFMAEQRELAKKATARPWAGAGRPVCIVTTEHEVIVWGQDSNVEGQHDNWNDIWFIEAAANHYPDALDAIDRLRAENDSLRADLDKLKFNLHGIFWEASNAIGDAFKANVAVGVIVSTCHKLIIESYPVHKEKQDTAQP
jgi:hypothetical protein